nr:Zinc carboxypeptidase-related protein [Leptospira interrogans serovar Copenhageni/Icterohaemorrhagiae]
MQFLRMFIYSQNRPPIFGIIFISSNGKFQDLFSKSIEQKVPIPSCLPKAPIFSVVVAFTEIQSKGRFNKLLKDFVILSLSGAILGLSPITVQSILTRSKFFFLHQL